MEEFYKTNHIGQTVDFVRKMREEYGKLNRTEMSIWECCELLNEFTDESDPDLDEPQLEHLLQTAEAIRKDYPDQDWLHLTGLVHGKFLFDDWLLIVLTNCLITYTGLMIFANQISERFFFTLHLVSFLNGLLLVSIVFLLPLGFVFFS